MNDILFYAAMVWMILLLIITAVMVIKAPTALSRVLAVDTLSLVSAAVLVLYSTTTSSSHYLDAALLLSLVSFLSTIAASRYYSEGRLFWPGKSPIADTEEGASS